MVNLMNPSVDGDRRLSWRQAGESLLAGIRETVYQRSLPLATEHLRIVAVPGRRARPACSAPRRWRSSHGLSAAAIEAAIEQAALRRPTA